MIPNYGVRLLVSNLGGKLSVAAMPIVVHGILLGIG